MMKDDLTETLARAICLAVGFEWWPDGKRVTSGEEDYPIASEWRYAATAAIEAIKGAGYAIVPRAATDDMLERGRWEAESCTNDWTCAAACLPGHVWSAMIQAAEGEEKSA